MNYEEGIEKALDGEAILFVGSGFSKGAVNVTGFPLKAGKELAKYFANRAGIKEEMPLEDSAEEFLKKVGPQEFVREIQKEYTIKELKDHHKQVANIPWKRIYTTNYDNTLEKAYVSVGKSLQPVTLSTDIYSIPKKGTICVHLNGYVGFINTSNYESELKLTDSSYVTKSIVDSPWAIQFKYDISIAKSVFFLGYSFSYDLDIKRILVELQSLKEKCFFAVGASIDRPTESRISKFGNNMNMRVDEFAEKINQIKQSYIPIDRERFEPLSITEHKNIKVTNKITDRSLFDLLIYGNSSKELIAESLRSNEKYFLRRSKADDVFSLIDAGNRVIIISSDLGNGKSLFVEGLHLLALEKGYRVFEVNDHSVETSQEIEMLSKLDDKVFLTVDEYQHWMKEIEQFRISASDNAVLLLTARSAVNDVIVEKLAKIANVASPPEIMLDDLNDDEVTWFIEVFNEYGFWGEKAGDSNAKKKRYLEHTCGKQIHAILLDLLNSNYIEDKLRYISEALLNQAERYGILISAFILRVLNLPLSIQILSDIWGAEKINNSSLRNDKVLKELIDINQDEIKFRSSIIAGYFLNKIANAGVVVNVLIVMIEKVHTGSRTSNQNYEMLFKELQKFSSLTRVLPEQGRKNAVYKYYESVKNLDKTKNEPLFWLQYAIATLVFKDLVRSGKYFETAYSLARKLEWYDTRQIDNHFARYLLTKAIAGSPSEDTMNGFRDAHNIIIRQTQMERKHYPYRVAILYQPFVEKFISTLTESETEEVERAAKAILEKITNMSKYRSEHKAIIECSKAMKYVLERTEEKRS